LAERIEFALNSLFISGC